MKILRIAVRNIASLSGLQVVDFTMDPLRSVGLFSITGVTGAGKSSLLDAMCLALYDTTPRLARLGRLAEVQGEKPGDPRALLRRGAAEGFAEVSFRGIDEQVWTARWSVRRSHLRVDGSLQSQDMVLLQGIPTPGGPGQPAAAGTRTEVKAAIQEKIGLDFNQFTRAVLLAQNEFSQFLKADDKDRAAILQLLTGTELFEDLSRSAYSRYTKERRDLDELRTIMQGLTPMPSADRLAAEEALSSARATLTKLESKQKTNDNWKSWHHQLDQLRQQQLHVQAEWDALNSNSARISALRSQLQLAEQVHRELKPIRQTELQIIADQKQVAEEILGFAEQEKTCRERQAELTQFDQQLKTNRQNLSQQLTELGPKFRHAEQLRGRIASAEASLSVAEKELRETEESLSEKQRLFAASNSEIKRLEAELSRIEREQLLFAEYAQFQNDVLFYENQLKQLVQLQQDRQQLQADTGDLKTATEKQSNVLQQLLGQQTLLAVEVSAAELKLKESSEKLNPDVQEQTLNELASCRATLEGLNALSSDFKTLNQLRSKRAKLIAAESKDVAELSTTEEQKSVVENRLAEAKIELTGANQTLSRMRAAIDDAAVRLRTTLVEGDACPVCGSLTHPYSDHPPDHNAIAIQAAQALIDERNTEVAELSAKAATLGTSQELLRQRLKQASEERGVIDAEIQELIPRMVEHPVLSRFPILSTDFPPETADRLQQLVQGMREEIKRLEDSDRAFRALQSDNAQHRQSVDDLKAKLQQQNREIDAAQQALRELDRKALLLDERLRESVQRTDLCMQQLAPVIAGVSDAETQLRDAPDGFLSRFVSGVAAARSLLQQKSGVESRLQTERQNRDNIDQMVQMLSLSWNRKSQGVETDRQSLELLINERRELFPGEEPELVEERKRAELDQLGQQIEANQQKLQNCQKDLATAESSHAEKSIRQQSLMTQLNETSATVDRWITGCSALSELERTREQIDAILSLDEAWFKSTRTEIETHDRQNAELSGRRTQLQQQIDQHLQTRSDVPELDKVYAELQQLLIDLPAAKHSVDSAQSVISVDDQRIRDNAEKLQQYTALEERIRPWEQLNDLIGSHDGAKFRGIAQRRTLDILLRYANVHLNQLSPRYRLERTAESLNLTVVDREMGDERRSVHSLSGGETFLASLALALGLASLASNRLRIESLFIDEGFGSLDQETLSIAIGALMQLESQGRKVGVISHVSEMSEAIPVQIRIQRQKAGASRIVIPGARELPIADEQPVTTTKNKSGPANPVGAVQTPEQVAEQILAILQTAVQSGKGKVSLTSLRSTIGCTPTAFKLGQQLIASKVEAEGKSLRLKQ